MTKSKNKMDLDVILVYPKVFNLAEVVDPETGEPMTGKPGDVDRGDAKAKEAWLRALAKNPVAKLQAYLTSETQIGMLDDHPDFERYVTNPKTGEKIDRIKDGNSEFGIGKFINLTRPLSDVKEFPDNKTGEIITKDYGGEVRVSLITLGEDGKLASREKYDYLEHGPISNGSRGLVKFEPRYLRLEAIGITDLVEFVPNEEEDF